MRSHLPKIIMRCWASARSKLFIYWHEWRKRFWNHLPTRS